MPLLLDELDLDPVGIEEVRAAAGFVRLDGAGRDAKLCGGFLKGFILDFVQPDSDLGDRLVVTGVPRLDLAERGRALAVGQAAARRFLEAGLIRGASLTLQGQTELLGPAVLRAAEPRDIEHA